MGCGSSRAMPVSGPDRDEAETPRLDTKDIQTHVSKEGSPMQMFGSQLGSARSERELELPQRSRDSSRHGATEDSLVAVALRHKRKAGVVLFGQSVVEPREARHHAPKDAATKLMISQALKDNVFFAELGEAEVGALVDAMEPTNIPAGAVVIKQGDPGDNFYVVEHGRFEIIVNGNIVVEWGDGTKNRSFGELALLYNLPRAATVRALTDSKLWLIDRDSFRHLMAQANHLQSAKLKAALRRGILEDCTDEQLDSIAAVSTIVKYNKGDRIIRKGDEGEVLFIIESGSVICKNMTGDQSNNVLTAGDYFGERALLKVGGRACDVEAVTDVSLIALHREDFEAKLGHLKDLFEYNIGMRLLLCMPLIGALPEEARAEVFNALSVAAYTAGAVICAQGKRADSFFIVKDASVTAQHLTFTSPAASPRTLTSTASTSISATTTTTTTPTSGKRPGSSAVSPRGEVDRIAVTSDWGVLEPGHWFPDKELDSDAPLPCSYVATADCQVFVLDRAIYLRHIAPTKQRLLAEGRLRLPPPSTRSAAEMGMGSPRFSTPRKGGDEPGSHHTTTGSRASRQTEMGVVEGGGARTSSPRHATSTGGGGASTATAGHARGGSEAGSRSGAGAVPTPSTGTGGGAQATRPREARRFSTDYKALPAAPVATTSPLPPPRPRLGVPLKDLELRATLGTGTFGRVRLAYHKKLNRVFALKMLQKHQIVSLKQQTNIVNEKDILTRVDHPFVIKLYDTYKDRDRLYMLLELVQGGELFSRLQNSDTPGRIRPDDARFYSACVLDAFDYLHSYNIIYRDLKPENLLIDSEGYLKLVDFGFAKVVRDKTYTLCGTPEYLAPELVLGRGHDKGVDYWALGILLFEQVSGYSPFADRAHNDQMIICKNILRGTVEFPTHFRDRELQNVILQLLVKDATRRLGCMKGGAGDVKAHNFFHAIDWAKLRRKEVRAPWRPKVSNPLDTSHFDDYDEDDHVTPYRDDDTGWEASF